MTGVAKKEIDFEKITKQNDENLLIICDDLDLYYSMKISEIAEHFFLSMTDIEIENCSINFSTNLLLKKSQNHM